MLTLNQVSALSEDDARETMERILWPNGPVCPHCGAVENLTRLQGKAHRTGVFQCNNCHDQFTVTVNTVFEVSHIPLRKWLMAFALLCSAKKGISALQLQRELELGSYRTAWHMAHRIRHAMSKEPLAGLLRGMVEVDETYVGGKPHPDKIRPHKIERVDGTTLKSTFRKHVDRSATIMTHEWPAYRGNRVRWRASGRYSRTGQYARGDAYANTAELLRSSKAWRYGVIPSYQQAAP
jgi:transposase-like protein